MMNVCVQGLWHLGAVTAACLAEAGHQVVGYDLDPQVIHKLNKGVAPIFEPGLDELLKKNLNKGVLHFTNDLASISNIEILWVAIDTPVNDEDEADVAFVINQVKEAIPYLPNGATILISSQMPVGTIRILEDYVKELFPNKEIDFACSPENLRLGKALDVFLNPDRIVVGVRTEKTKKTLEKLLLPITSRIEWMSVESAEMTKHAINSFLASSVTFINEIAALCELVGADAKEVERGLKTEMRIGPKAYLAPGGPFAGGTLARDIEFLNIVGQKKKLSTPLLASVKASNNEHKNWVRRKLFERYENLSNIKVAIWGLTYKSGTDTLRRSLAVELCDWLIEQGAIVCVYDPVVKALPTHWLTKVIHHTKPLDAVKDADILVIGTEWPEFRQHALELEKLESKLCVIDANRYLASIILPLGIPYFAVGSPCIKERSEC